MGRACSTLGRDEISVGNSESKEPLRRPGRRWKANVRLDLCGSG
jgi:hypothetical protein